MTARPFPDADQREDALYCTDPPKVPSIDSNFWVWGRAGGNPKSEFFHSYAGLMCSPIDMTTAGT